MAAAITLAQSGLAVTVYEKNEIIGGTCRSLELIKRGCFHDIGSAVYPLVLASPFFQKLPLEEFGLKWMMSPLAAAHPFDDGTAAVISRSIAETSSTLDRNDGKAYIRLMTPLANQSQILINEIMQFPKIPFRHPFLMLDFGRRALCSTTWMAKNLFKGERARAVIAGLGAHSVMRLEKPASFASGFMLAVAAHTTGWPFPEGGSQKITEALAGYLNKLGGKIFTSSEMQSMEQLPNYDLLMLDVTPQQFLKMAEQRLPDSYKHKLGKYEYGPGVFKGDWIMDGPIPWKARECHSANTVHIGGYLEEIAASERDVHLRRHPEKPFVFLTQPSLFDHTRTNSSEHIVWGYCHVPKGSSFDMTGRIESQIERFAPGFKDRILARHIMSPSDMEQDNPNCVGGDITGGSQSLKKLLMTAVSYETPIENVFLCSSSTPPSPGVHGMCGFRAAQKAIRKLDYRLD